ncbi:MAG TPA: efflux RND transporter periplasmic adaptor subunit, partial [Gammaproteobacteria bacterium]|nr:efflux RND transporter periplasmic adaptor subunit [Gammaproteobacteria bacterium]
MSLPRPPVSVVIAFLVALALVLWMASGYLAPGVSESDSAAPAAAGPEVVAVQVRQQTAETVTRYLRNNGQTEAERVVRVKAETAGPVAEVVAEDGTRVAAGQPLVRLAMDDRRARLAEAQALVAQRETEAEAAKALGSSGFQARARVEEAEAALASARARLARIREDIDHTVVRAPFAGVLEERLAETGDFLDVGAPVAVVADLDPLVVSVHIVQQRIGEVTRGGSAEVRLP